MFEEMAYTIGKPFREEIPMSQLLIYAVAYAILAYIAFDAVRIVGSYMKSAVE